jgi:hypothetical protein
MPCTPPPVFRKEVQDYLRSCEELLAFADTNAASFSPEEPDVIERDTAKSRG